MDLREFIENHKNEINLQQFEEIYSSATEKLPPVQTGELTKLFYKCGIDPLKYMSRIPDNYYAKLKLRSVNIPNNITSIGTGAFYKCPALASITIPNSVISIGYGAFFSCISLKNITISDSVTNIGTYALGACTSLTNIEFLGTMKQWEAIDKVNGIISDDVPTKVVHCSDGDIGL